MSTTPTAIPNDRAVQLRTDIYRTLAVWSREAVERRHLTPPPDTVKAMSAFIYGQLDWYLAQQWTRQFINDLQLGHEQSGPVIHPNPVRMFEVASCPEDGCTGSLWARIRPADRLLPHDITCDTSPVDDNGQPLHYWPANTWLTLGRRIKRSA